MTKPCAEVRVADSGSLVESPSILDNLYSQGSHFVRGILVAFGILLIAANADAIVIDFSTNPDSTAGELGPSLLDVNGVDVHGFYFDGASWGMANLFRRNDAEDHGLGVCNPDEDCEETDSEGDINELDNAGHPELIRLTLPSGFLWTEVAVSSLDTNGSQDPDHFERGQAFATNDSDPANAASGVAFWQFAGNGAVEVTHAVEGADQLASYIFFRPYDWSGGIEEPYYNEDNDFLVWQVTIEPVPEPGTVFLLAGGLLGLVLAVRRKKS